jgi:ferritin-like metal-binding protein YciE
LQDIYYAEKTLSKTLPNMAKNASTPQLAISNNHLKDTNEQISRLKKYLKLPVLNLLQRKALQGILKENNDISIKRTKALFAMLV